MPTKATEVGVAYISIVPSTKDFASKLEKSLNPEKLGRQLGRDMSKGMAKSFDGKTLDGMSRGAAQEGAKAGALFGKGFTRTAQAETARAGVLGGVGGKMDSALGGLKTAAVMLGGIGIAAGVVGKSFFDAYSDLQESTSKAQVVFGAGWQKVDQFAQNAATTMGMSRQKALEAAGTFGNLFRAMGMGADKSSEMSTKLLQLSGDLASFNNVDPTEVLEALRSGLVGEAEPLRRFGVNINEARIEAEAYRLGLAKGKVDIVEVESASIALDKAQVKQAETMKKYGAGSKQVAEANNDVAQAQAKLAKQMKGAKPDLDANTKAQAVYSIIMRDTSLAQGDYARTAEGAANKQRTLTARWEDFTAKAGAIVAPVAGTLLDAMSTGLTGLSDWFTLHQTEIESGLGTIKTKFFEIFGPDPVQSFKDGVTVIQTSLDGVFGEDKIGNFWTGAGMVSAKMTELFGPDPVQSFKDGVTEIQSSLDGTFGEDKIGNFMLGAGIVSGKFHEIFGPDPVQSFKDGLTEIQTATNGVFGEDKIGAFLGGAKKVGEAFGNLGEPIGWIIDQIEEIPKQIGKLGEPFGWIIDQWEKILDLISKLGEPLGWVLDKIEGLPDWLGEQDKKVQGMADGGVVAGTVGAPRMILAHGGETVLPTHQPALAGLRGINAAAMGAASMSSAGAAQSGPALNIEHLSVTGQADPNASAAALARELRRVGYFAGGTW